MIQVQYDIEVTVADMTEDEKKEYLDQDEVFEVTRYAQACECPFHAFHTDDKCAYQEQNSLTIDDDGNGKYVRCDTCQCQGPTVEDDDPNAAIMAWNSWVINSNERLQGDLSIVTVWARLVRVLKGDKQAAAYCFWKLISGNWDETWSMDSTRAAVRDICSNANYDFDMSSW